MDTFDQGSNCTRKKSKSTWRGPVLHEYTKALISKRHQMDYLFAQDPVTSPAWQQITDELNAEFPDDKCQKTADEVSDRYCELKSRYLQIIQGNKRSSAFLYFDLFNEFLGEDKPAIEMDDNGSCGTSILPRSSTNQQPTTSASHVSRPKKVKLYKCAVAQCGNRATAEENDSFPQLILFPSPPKPTASECQAIHYIYRKWLSACDPDLRDTDWKICSVHFEPRDFECGSDGWQLKPTAFPSRLLEPSQESTSEYETQLAFLQKQMDLSCRKRWEEITSHTFKPPQAPNSGIWSVFDQDPSAITFGRVRKRVLFGGRNSSATTPDFIRFDTDMTVSLTTGTTDIPVQKFTHLLKNGRAMTVKQIEDIFGFNFAEFC